MAALVADVTRVENLTEQFGRQRLEEGLGHRAENLVSHLSAENSTSDVRFSSHRGKWLICDGTPANSKHERRASQGIEQHSVSRHLQQRESPQLVSEVCIVNVVGNKRNLKRNQAVKSTRGEKEYILAAKDKFSSVCNAEGDEGFDLSSSSDDELRELFLCKVKPPEMDSDLQEKANSAEVLSAQLTVLARDQGDKADTRRKRNKLYRGSLKKKIKFSRPCLDLEKMEARRLEYLKTDNKKPENIFHPIHQM